MLWFWIVIGSQFAQAIALFLDKFLLVKKFPKPAVLTFWTSVGNLLGLVFVFWDFNFFPGWYLFILSIGSGVAFTIALQFFYMAMSKGEASHISPLVGAVVPIGSFIISYFWLSERLSFNQMVAVGLLVVGALIISFETTQKRSGWHIGMLYAVIAGLLFAVSYVLVRGVYLQETFATGFVWARVGAFVASVPLLFTAANRKAIFFKEKQQKKQAASGLTILAINKTLAALYFIGMNFAISLASATLVNALAGLQFALLFVIIYISSTFFAKFFKEYFTKAEIVQQIIAIILIVAGLAYMVL